MDDAAPDLKALVGAAFSAAAATYDDVIDFFGPFGRALAEAADLGAGHRVLDLACGRGASLLPAVEAVGPSGHVLGIDIAPGMVARLSAELAAAGATTAEVRAGDAEHLDLPDGSFDRVLAGFMIFFCSDPGQALAEIHRVLRPGGRVALSVFDGPSGFPFLREIVTELLGPQESRPAEAFMMAQVLEDALRDLGFTVLPRVAVQERFVFTDSAHVLRWYRSHGGRMLLDSLDERGTTRFEALVAERLDQGHQIAEGYELVQSARICVAQRP